MEQLKSIADRVLAGHVEPRPSTSREARQQFAKALDHLAAAYRHEMVDEAVAVYWHALKDIPLEIRAEGMSRCAATLKFFPTVAELRTACCDVVDERRKRAAVTAKVIQEGCLVCLGTGWQNVTVNGELKAARCDCFKRALKLVQDAGQAIQRPALVEHQEDPL
jgi:predicted urease superfamily metal-dependent hydrolase